MRQRRRHGDQLLGDLLLQVVYRLRELRILPSKAHEVNEVVAWRTAFRLVGGSIVRFRETPLVPRWYRREWAGRGGAR